MNFLIMRNKNNEILDKRFVNIFNKFNNIDNAIYQTKIINKNNNENNNNSKNKINKNVIFKKKENNKFYNNNNDNNSRNNKKILKKNKTEKIFNNFYSNNNNNNFEENNENESTRRETLHFTSKFNYDSLNNNNNNSTLIENNNNNNNFYNFDNKKITFGSKICDCYQKYSNNFSFNPKISKNSLKINKNLELNGNNFISRILAKKHKNYNNKFHSNNENSPYFNNENLIEKDLKKNVSKFVNLYEKCEKNKILKEIEIKKLKDKIKSQKQFFNFIPKKFF